MRRIFSQILLLCVAIALIRAQDEDPFDCTFGIKDDQTKNDVNFDLSKLTQMLGKAYSADLGQSKLFWNVCDRVDPSKIDCPEDFKPTEGQAFSVIQKEGNKCYDLGTVKSRSSDKADAKNIAAGIVMKYESEKEECTYDDKTSKRYTSVRYLCDSVAKEDKFYVYEKKPCHYEIEFYTQLACSESCRSSNERSVNTCSGHGICALDPQASNVRCLCNRGFDGQLCGDKTVAPKPSKSTTPLLAGLVITLMILLIIVTVNIVRKIRKLSSGDSHYSRMSAVPNASNVQPGHMPRDDSVETSLPNVPFPEVSDIPARTGASSLSSASATSNPPIASINSSREPSQAFSKKAKDGAKSPKSVTFSEENEL